MAHRFFIGRLAILRALLAVAALSLLLRGAVAHADGPIYFDETSIDFEDGDDGVPLGTIDSGIAYLSDCTAVQTPPACGDPPARWSIADRRVRMCTFESNRPSWLTADQFRHAVAAAALAWSNGESQVGISYSGDCTSGTTWEDDNLQNEIGFDDSRMRVKGGAVASTRTFTNWTPQSNPTSRTITGADIVMDDGFPNIPLCFNTTMIHEMGHALGFGHSPVKGDVMYPSFSPSDPSVGCPQAPSAAEQSALQTLYGVNRRPTVTGGSQSETVGSVVTLNGSGSDPDGDAISYAWVQTGGITIAISNAAAEKPTFLAETAGTAQFQVTASDVYEHSSTAVRTVTINDGKEGPVTSRLLPASGIGLFVFAGGSNTQLLQASGCPASTAVFWASDTGGGFVTYVPGATISVVNVAWHAQFPTGPAAGTPLLGRCNG